MLQINRPIRAHFVLLVLLHNIPTFFMIIVVSCVISPNRLYFDSGDFILDSLLGYRWLGYLKVFGITLRSIILVKTLQREYCTRSVMS